MKNIKFTRAASIGLRKIFREQNKFKRWAYFWASLLSIPAITWTFILRFQYPLWRTAYGILLVGLVISTLALLNHNLPIRWVERFIVIINAIFGFIKYIFLVNDPASHQLPNWLGEIQGTFWNIGIGLILIYIVFERKKAFWLCLAQILLILVITWPHFGSFSGEIMREFLRLETRLLAVSFLTLVLAKAKDDLVDTQTRALDVETLAYIDLLTGLPNRRAFQELIQLHLSKPNPQIGLVIADVDFFKSINDTYGHETGDIVLRETALLLKNSLRESDWVGRWGGEEFIILLEKGDVIKNIQTIERIRQQFANTPLKNGLQITLSFGGSNFETGDDFESLFARADQALYAAKSRGRNRIEWF